MERLVFMGTPHFGALVLEPLIGHYDIVGVITQPDREAGRGRKLSMPAVKRLALDQHLPVFQPMSLRQADFAEQLHTLDPAVIVVAAYGKILPDWILSLARFQCINVHASLLPRHRGAAPIPAAILAGDRQTGVTVMVIAPQLDTGPILSQATVDITNEDTAASLTDTLGALGGKLLADTLPHWMAGQITPQIQGESPTPYAAQLRHEDGHIQWAHSAESIARQCRAFYPWPRAFAFWRGVELQVLRARPVPIGPHDFPPGTVIWMGPDIAVVTGHDALILEELQLAGKRPLPVIEFVRGQRSFVGSKLE